MKVPRFLLVIAMMAAGCAVEPTETAQEPEPEPAYTVVEAPLASTSVAGSLVKGGFLTTNEALHLAPLGTDIAYEVFVTPPAPGKDDRLVYALVTWPGAATPKSAAAQMTTDGWSTQKDLAGKVTVVQGRPSVVFDLGKFPVGTQVRTTFKVVTATGVVLLDHGGKDWLTSVLAVAPLQGVGSLEARQDGWKRKLPGDALFSAHPLAVTVETWPEVPGVNAILHWKVGAGPVTDTPMGIDAIHYGGYGLNTKWIGLIPAAQLMPGSNLTFWVEAACPKNTLWDSLNGKNYKGFINAPPGVQWAQTGHTQFSKAWQTSPDGVWKAGYMFFPSLETPFISQPSGYWPPPKPAVELYVPAVTDVAGAIEAAKGGFVRVEVWSPFFSGKPTGDWHAYQLEFFENFGNNWRFEWNVRQHGSPLSSPNGVAWVDDGNYPYKFRISTDNGQSWKWLGTGPLPSGGDNLLLEWHNLTYPPQLTVSGKLDMPKTKAGKSSTQKVDLVNTGNDTLTIKSCTVKDGVGALAMTLKGCPKTGKTTTLAPGKRVTASLTFKPKKSGTYTATLTLDLVAPKNPAVKGIFTVTLSGVGY